MKIKRNQKATLTSVGVNQYEVTNQNGDVVLDSNSDYHIYMMNVNLKNGNVMEGRYLGELEDNASIVNNGCLNLSSKDGDFYANGKKIKKAKMVAINNKTRAVVIIFK